MDREEINRKANFYSSYTFNGILRCAVARSRWRSKKYGIPFDLDVDYVFELLRLQEGRCYYTAIPFSLKKLKNRHMNAYAPSLERIEKEKGYIKGNVVLVCQAANMAKGELTYQEYIRFCEAAVNNRHIELVGEEQ